MKNTMLLFVLLPFFGFGQVDTAAVRAEVDSLIQICQLLMQQKDFEKALEVNTIADKLALENLSRESAAYSNSCFNRSKILILQGNYQEAEKWCLESKAIREKVIGKEHPDYAWSLDVLANINYRTGNYEVAEPLYLEAKTIREKVLGKEHSDYAKSAHSLARLYWIKGQYDLSELYYLEAIAIRKKVLGEGHTDYSASLGGLGVLYYEIGNYEKAEPLFLEAKAIDERELGKEHPRYAVILNNLAILYAVTSNYEKAERFFLEALAIREKRFGRENPDYAISLNNLAILYGDMGNYEKSEFFLLEAKAIQEKLLGKEHLDYAWSLNNLAILYGDMGNHEEAKRLFEEVLIIIEKVLGNEHLHYATTLSSFATFYGDLGEYEKAKPLFEKAMDIIERVLGKENPNYAASQHNLAVLYSQTGNYEKARPLFEESLAIREKVLGKEHTHSVESWHHLARLHWQMSNYDKVGPLLIEANKTEQSLLSKASRHLSERELSAYTNKFLENLSQFFSFSQIQIRFSKTAYDNALFYKGFLLNATEQLGKLAHADPASLDTYYRLKSYHRRLAAEYAKPIAERQNVAELEEKANTLEKELVRTVAGYGEAIRQVEWVEVRDALQPGEAAVEFVHYDYYTPEPTDSVMYAALVLRPGDDAPHFIPLFEEKELQALLKENPKGKKAYLNELYGHKKKKATSSNLYRLIWQPLEELLGDAETVYASPSGLLHRINLGAVMVNRKKVWGDRHELVLMGSTRQLAIRRNSQFAVFTRPRHEDGRRSPDQVVGQPSAGSPPSAGSLSATLYGGIHYDMDSTAIARANQGEEPIASIGGELHYFPLPQNRERFGRGRDWVYLPETGKEADQIRAIIFKQKGKAEVLKGYSATEESFKRLGHDGPSPRILHIATHGYFYPDPEETRERVQLAGSSVSAPAFKISEHPMIRSGLAMAGGNQAWRGKPVPKGLEDGILTAYEVSQVDLRNTELVVLSACETGLGDIEGNEGVYGLQRAFKIAGADKLIMSLWNVPDAQTQEMMVLFYRYWLEEGMALSEAFRAAQGEMRKRYGEHYYWAAFVLVE